MRNFTQTWLIFIRFELRNSQTFQSNDERFINNIEIRKLFTRVNVDNVVTVGYYVMLTYPTLEKFQIILGFS